MTEPSIFELLGDVLARVRRDKTEKPVLTLSLLAGKSLRTVFQPLVDLQNGAIVAHEALVRPPLSMNHLTVHCMLRAARLEHCQKNFELICLEHAAQAWSQKRSRGMLFVNLSAKTLLQLHQADRIKPLLDRMRQLGVPARNLGLDVSDFGQAGDMVAMVDALRPLRQAGVVLALDDFKATGSGMHIWARMLPSVIKLAPRWTRDITTNQEKAEAVVGLVRLTRKHHRLLVAKGVETAEELRALKTLGVDVAQGHFLGCPDSAPVTRLNHRAHAVLFPPVLTELASNEARAVSIPAAIQRWWDSKC